MSKFSNWMSKYQMQLENLELTNLVQLKLGIYVTKKEV